MKAVPVISETAGSARARRGGSPGMAAIAAASILVVSVALWRTRLPDEIRLSAAPFTGTWDPRLGPAVAFSILVAALIVWRGPRLASELSFRRLLVATFAASAAWGVSLALVDGAAGLTNGITSPHGYSSALDLVEAPGPFLRAFIERIDDYTVHVRGHPPGLMVALWWLDRLGFEESTSAAWLLIGAGAWVTPAVLVAAREVAGEERARTAAPFLVLAPAAVWMVTSADALFAAVGAGGVALIVLATGHEGARADALAAAGGSVWGFGLFLSYGLLPLGAVAFVVAAARRKWRLLFVAGLAIGVVVAIFAWFGFSWPSGLAATRREYYEGIGGTRPYTYFLVANLAAFAVVTGPATAAGLARLRDPKLWLLVGGALVAVAVADLSGLSKGEVERIWLPFWPWVGLAAAAVTSRLGTRRWLAAQAAVGIAVQTLVLSPW